MALAQKNKTHLGAQLIRSRALLYTGLALSVAVLVGLVLVHVMFGAAEVAPADVAASFAAYEPDNTSHIIVRTLRVPRVVIAVVIGGAIMQGLTRNPLASPSILGINAGAVLAVVSAIFFLGITSATAYAWFGFAGAAIAAVVVYGIGSVGRSGPTPAKLTIAGAAITALASALTTTILIFSQQTTDQIRFWLAGSVAGRDLALFVQVAPYLAVGFVVALVLARQITTLSLGDDVARGLGQNTRLIQGLSAVSVVLLAGAAVAVAGPIGFIGLVIPHVVRFFVGVDYRWILPYSALFGAILLVAADIGARLIIRPMELPVGIVTALMGAPVFIYLARWKIRR